MNELLRQILEAFAAGGAEQVQPILSETNDLAPVETEAVQALQSIASQDTLSAADADAAEQIAELIDVIRAELSVRAAAAQETADRVTQAASRVLGQQGDTDTGETTETEGGEQFADAGSGGETNGSGPDLVEQPEEPVTASAPPARRPRANASDVLNRLANARRTQPPPPVQEAPRPLVSLIAAAEVPGYTNGSLYADVSALAIAAIDKFRGMPRRPTRPGEPVASGLALIRREFPEYLTARSHDDVDVLDRAVDQSRLPQSSLVAAGGWCAPSETVYDVFELEDTDGLLSVPEINLVRGGIRFSAGPNFATIYSGAGFHQTEAESIAGDDKTFYTVPCPSFVEERLRAIGVGVTVGILENAAYPEFVARIIRGVLAVHAHKLNYRSIAAMVTGSTTVDYSTGVTPASYITAQGATSVVLETMEMQAIDYRTRHRMADTAVLEAVAPRWLRGVIRADLSKRNGQPLGSVSNAQITQWFADRQISVQWVEDWQDGITTDGTVGGATAIKVWPTSAKFLLYAAGTWVRGMRDVIRLDAGVYDHPGLVENNFDTLFTEEGYAMVKRGHDSRIITVPICASGHTAPQVDMDCTA